MEPPSIRQNCWRSKRAGPVCSESVRKWIFPIQKGEEPAELCMLISPRPGRHHGRAKNCWASANLACRIGLVWETHIRPHRWWCCGRPSSQKSQPPGDLPRPPCRSGTRTPGSRIITPSANFWIGAKKPAFATSKISNRSVWRLISKAIPDRPQPSSNIG